MTTNGRGIYFVFIFQYILVVMASDTAGDKLEEPMEIHVLVQDENDSEPECSTEDNVFEMQEGEPVGKKCVCWDCVSAGASKRGSVCSCSRNFKRLFILNVSHCCFLQYHLFQRAIPRTTDPLLKS